MKIPLQKTFFIAFIMFIGLGINQTASAATYYLTAAGSGSAQTPASWNTVASGTGVAAPNFSTPGDTFTIPVGINGVVTGNWILGDNINGGSNQFLNIQGSLTINNGISLTLTQKNPRTTTLNVLTGGTIIFLGTSTANQLLSVSIGSTVGTFNLSSEATLKTANAAGIQSTTNGSINTSNITSTFNTGAIYEFNGTAAQVTLGMPTTVATLKINNAAGVTLSAIVTASTLTIGDITASSKFNDGGFQVGSTGILNLTSGTFKLGASAAATTFPAFATKNISSGTTVEYAATADQSCAAIAYQNLIFSGSGAKSIVTGTSVVGNLSISGATASLGAGLNISVGTLTLGGLGTSSGVSTWGSTSSSATYKNNTYFAATTGMLNVLTNTGTTPTVTPTVGSYTYNGVAQGPNSATNTGTSTSYTYVYVGVSGTIYSASAIRPINAGNYTVTATVAASADGFYKTASSNATAFTIGAATPTLSVTNTPQIYIGSSIAATVTGTGGGIVSNIKYAGSSTAPTNAGTYAITADIAASANYLASTGVSAGNFVINKATPTLSVTNSPVIYNGAGLFAALSSSVAGTVSSILTGGNATQTNASTYAVTANFVPTDAINYNSLTAASAGNFVINKATPTLSVTNSSVIYNGTGQAAAVSGSVAGAANRILTGSNASQTNASTYGVTANFVPTDATNYNTLTAASAGNFVISPIALAITADSASKCFGSTHILGTTNFTSIGLVSPQTIGGVTLTSAGAVSGAEVNPYSIVPSAATGGTFLPSNYTITYTNGTLTVIPTNTVGTASSTPTLCVNTPLSTITHATTGATGIGAATALPAGVTAVFASNTITISGTPMVSGIFNYSIPLTGGCGNVNATGTITVDTTAPVLSGVPANTAASCDTIPEAATPTASDNCDASPLISLVETSTQTPAGVGHYNYSVTRVWTATDVSGNESSGTQVITVSDNTAPVLLGVPANTTASCASIPVAATPTATDNCDSIPVISLVETSTQTESGLSHYNYTITRVWTANDAAGNPSTQTQDIVVNNVKNQAAKLTISDNSICKYVGTTDTITFTTDSGASSYNWVVSNSGITIVSGQGTNTLVVDLHTATISGIIVGEVSVETVNPSGCYLIIGKRHFRLSVRFPTVPSSVSLKYNGIAISSAGNFVGDDTKTLVLTATDNSGTADYYQWELPAGVTVVRGNPDYDKEISINLGGISPANTVLAITVHSVANCGYAGARILQLTRTNPGTPAALALTDNAISSLIKITNVSAYTGKLKTTTLTLTATPNATAGYESASYKWVLPPGIEIVGESAELVSEASGFKTYTSTSNVISINLSGVGNAKSLLIKVYGVNGNGESLLSRNLTLTSAIPAKTGALTTISGAIPTYHPSCNTITVKLPNMFGLTYSWSVTAGAAAVIVSSNSDGNEVTIDVSGLPSTPLASYFKISVTSSNGTGTSIASIYTIKLGSPCTSGSRMTSQKMTTPEIVSGEFNAIAYPNPSSGAFNIKIESSYKGETDVKVCDMTGRLIERFKVQSNSVELGSKYTSGVYNFIVNQDGKFKILRVIKE